MVSGTDRLPNEGEPRRGSRHELAGVIARHFVFSRRLMIAPPTRTDFIAATEETDFTELPIATAVRFHSFPQ